MYLESVLSESQSYVAERCVDAHVGGGGVGVRGARGAFIDLCAGVTRSEVAALASASAAFEVGCARLTAQASIRAAAATCGASISTTTVAYSLIQ